MDDLLLAGVCYFRLTGACNLRDGSRISGGYGCLGFCVHDGGRCSGNKCVFTCPEGLPAFICCV